MVSVGCVLGKQPANSSLLLCQHCPVLVQAPWGSRRGLEQTLLGRQETVEMVIKRSVEKDHWPTGWILTAVKWFSLGIAPSVAADRDCCYLYLHLICTREMPRASGDRPGGSLSPTTWLLQRANCFTSKKKERGKLRGAACAFILQHPFLLYKQSKVTQNTATTWGHCLIILADWCGQQMSPRFLWAGAPWASHPQGGSHRSRAAAKQILWKDQRESMQVHSYLCSEGFLHPGNSCSFSGTTPFSKR